MRPAPQFQSLQVAGLQPDERVQITNGVLALTLTQIGDGTAAIGGWNERRIEIACGKSGTERCDGERRIALKICRYAAREIVIGGSVGETAHAGEKGDKKERSAQSRPHAADHKIWQDVAQSRRRSLRCILGARIIVEERTEPAFGGGDVPALAPGIVLDLIALDLADAEIAALGMRIVEAA